MAEIEIETGLRENTIGMVEAFVAIAETDPISALLLVVGAILIAFSAGVFALLTVGAVGGSLRRVLSRPGVRPR